MGNKENKNNEQWGWKLIRGKSGSLIRVPALYVNGKEVIPEKKKQSKKSDDPLITVVIHGKERTIHRSEIVEGYKTIIRNDGTGLLSVPILMTKNGEEIDEVKK